MNAHRQYTVTKIHTMTIWNKIFGKKKKSDNISPEGHAFLLELEEANRKNHLKLSELTRRVMSEMLPQTYMCARGETLRHGISEGDFNDWMKSIINSGYEVSISSNDWYTFKNNKPK